MELCGVFSPRRNSTYLRVSEPRKASILARGLTVFQCPFSFDTYSNVCPKEKEG